MSFAALISVALSTACRIAATVLKLSGVLEVFKIVGKSLCEIGQCLGILPPDKEIEDIGDQALQADEAGIKPENYSNYEDYKKAVESFEVNPERSRQLTLEQKIQKALEYESLGLCMKYPELPIEKIFTTVAQNSVYLTPERTAQLGSLIKDNVGLLADITNYISGEEKSFDKVDSVLGVLTDIEKKLEPGITDAEAMKRISDCL